VASGNCLCVGLAPGLHFTLPAMTKTTLAYGFLLVVAFVVGLCGTLAASRAVLRMQHGRVIGIERPASAPEAPRPARNRAAIDC
jgi:hypothetical protein